MAVIFGVSSSGVIARRVVTCVAGPGAQVTGSGRLCRGPPDVRSVCRPGPALAGAGPA